MNTRPLVIAVLLLAACAGNPPADWQINAKDSLDGAVEAYLGGNNRLEARQFARGQAEVARTGQVPLAARVELLRCATRVAGLDFDQCPKYQALDQDATPAEQAYARYLTGRAGSDDLARLPPAAREIMLSPTPATLASIADPFARLVAAGTLLRRGLANDNIIAIAVDSASAQGWRRPLLAWLTVQQKQAAARGASEEVARLQRRIDLVNGRIP
ncbi:MAG TPA: hypothetical protein PKN13_02130 [Accumulibacter sp.]|nr:hypothetical protein [Accumulibacter sp.]HMW17669.1 hypothetical protein [Accumulibacter sp.]HMX22077.1 hypothetical protein [Accumulibacter sp.]HMY05751.1 hypothetical protein [Accumulibacter sp.]HNC16571.1 hypothetical protein [Accumulibacter sp.]